MEMRVNEDILQWPFMPKNPNSSEQHLHDVTSPQNPSLRNHISQNPTSLNHLYQNPNPQDHRFQNPITSQNHHNTLLLPENHPRYHMNSLPYHRLESLESGVQLNPSFTDSQTLQDYFSQLNLSSPADPPDPPIAYSPISYRQAPRLNLSSPVGYSPISYPPQPVDDYEFYRMRIEGAARGQLGFTHGVPLMSNEGLTSNSTAFHIQNGWNLNSTPIRDRNGSNSTAFHGYRYGNTQNGGQNLASAMNGSSSSRPNISNDLYLQHMSLSADELSHAYSVRPNANRDNTRIDSRFQRSRPRLINGLESGNGNGLLSSLYNHQYVRPRRRSSYSSLEELKGRVPSVAKDQQGCRLLQHMVEETTPENIAMLFSEVKDDFHKLMVDHVANYFIQKLIEACNEEQMNELVYSLVNDKERLMNICVHSHGTRAVQKLVEHVTTREQRALLISALKCITVTLTKSMHGHHVIQQCVRQFSNEETKHLLEEIAENCLDIATDKSGCCVLQQCVAHAEGEPKERLIAEITANALVLSEHPYGNYVVQYLLGMKIPRVTANILAQLSGSYVNLSLNKYGSNVVEKCLKESGEEQSHRIIEELKYDADFSKVIQDPFGNYVVQSALSVTKGDAHERLAAFIESLCKNMSTHLYAKNVASRAKRKIYRF